MCTGDLIAELRQWSYAGASSSGSYSLLPQTRPGLDEEHSAQSSFRSPRSHPGPRHRRAGGCPRARVRPWAQHAAPRLEEARNLNRTHCRHMVAGGQGHEPEIEAEPEYPAAKHGGSLRDRLTPRRTRPLNVYCRPSKPAGRHLSEPMPHGLSRCLAPAADVRVSMLNPQCSATRTR